MRFGDRGQRVTISDDLLRVLERHIGARLHYRSPPTRLSGGFWAAIYTFALADAPRGWTGDLVLRVMPDRDVAVKETAAQRELAAQGYPTPAVLVSGCDEALGGAFMIMPRAPGRPPLGALHFGRALLELPRTVRHLPDLLARTAHQLHSIEPTPIRAALADAGIDASRLGANPYLNTIARAAQTAGRGFVEFADWFQQQPTRQRANDVVCHGDLHPFNLLVTADGQVTVLDWSNANICARELDIGFTAALLRCAPIRVPAPFRPAIRRVANHLAERFITSYAATTTPLDREALRRFEALQYARCLAETALGRADPAGVVGADHPFEVSASDMTRQLTAITGIEISLPARELRPR
jgi:aminoglycoside phosphotransferase (APT) family kinase protein